MRATNKLSVCSLVFLFCCCSPWHIASARKQIKHLPGFDGSLPFALETGYLEVDEENGVNFFYYFIESERNPKEDPLMLWLTGGPGCSAFSGLVFEVGPLSFDLQGYTGGLPSLFYKPDSWTKVSSIIFVDSPVGTGFSYSHTSEGYQSSDTKTVRQLLNFLYKWIAEHPEFKSNPLYIGGDSYSGMIIPALTFDIVVAKESYSAPFNLKGYLAGNPITDYQSGLDAKVPFVHGMALISDELYESTKISCSGKYANPSNIKCIKYLDDVDQEIKDINPNYILEPICAFYAPQPGQLRNKRNAKELNEIPLCISSLPMECRSSEYLLSTFWANDGTVRDALGIPKETIGNWQRCNLDIPYTSDIESAVEYHLSVTNKGYLALIYSGDHDMIVPYIATQAWIRSLNFSIIDDWRPWYVGGQVAGFTRRYSNNITFATVKDAGHTAPEYKPKECLGMVRRWLSGAPL